MDEEEFMGQDDAYGNTGCMMTRTSPNMPRMRLARGAALARALPPASSPPGGPSAWVSSPPPVSCACEHLPCLLYLL
jgi:hypothetical protein